MAILNFTKISSPFVFLPLLKRVFLRTHHEKISCSLDQLSDKQLLLLNGQSVQVAYISPFHSFQLKKVGRVVAVIIPFSRNGFNPEILFLPDGESHPDFLNDVIITNM